MALNLLTSVLLIIITSLVFLLITSQRSSKTKGSSSSYPSSNVILPKCYPIVGSFFSFQANKNQLLQWVTKILQNIPSATFTLHRLGGQVSIFTANPANVQHILKTNFKNYPKGAGFGTTLSDFLGHGIFNIDGEQWKFQRQISSHEFNTKTLRKFVETVVETELSDRLIPILEKAAADKQVLDFQDVLQRFAFDNICRIAFGYDPEYLLPSFPKAKFAQAFDECVKISSERFQAPLPIIWKAKRLLNIGSERRLKLAISEVKEFSKNIIKEKKQNPDESMDLLTRFLSAGKYDDDFVTDIVISFTLAGRDTTSAALTWFFMLISKHPEAEKEILNEIKEKSDTPVYEDIKDMVYTHASLCESMRFYPPVPVDSKVAENDDVLPDGTIVKKGMRVAYHPYAMGRMEKLWGKDWSEFKPERWLKREEDGSWSFVGRDSYKYPVFQAGPRICLGKEMAFLQMKRVVSGVLKRFKVVPVIQETVEPEFVAHLTAKMKGGFPVRIEERNDFKL
ncbi:cytochrome P450 94A2-like [Mangifera indica]|uniref:cytochrome P450 94A2-like n=1 Tax=Mangifera indica TaxID=29780 RepID=UPI001CFB0610|nr:cytochrome P450 94A2-like [Mangifera indica]